MGYKLIITAITLIFVIIFCNHECKHMIKKSKMKFQIKSDKNGFDEFNYKGIKIIVSSKQIHNLNSYEENKIYLNLGDITNSRIKNVKKYLHNVYKSETPLHDLCSASIEMISGILSVNPLKPIIRKFYYVYIPKDNKLKIMIDSNDILYIIE